MNLIIRQQSRNPFTRWVDARIDLAITRHRVDKHDIDTTTLCQHQLMRRLGIDSMADFDKLHRAGELPCEARSGFFGAVRSGKWWLRDVRNWENRILRQRDAARVKAHLRRTLANLPASKRHPR